MATLAFHCANFFYYQSLSLRNGLFVASTDSFDNGYTGRTNDASAAHHSLGRGDDPRGIVAEIGVALARQG
jgi:hypothetical protein